jgi:excisionase family DNA binding protein
MNTTSLLTYKEACKKIGVTAPTFRKMLKNGFPDVDVGKKKTKILLRDVEEYILKKESVDEYIKNF